MLSVTCSQTVVVAVLATLLEYDYKIIQTVQKRYRENKGKGINTNRCRSTYAKHCCPNHHLSAKTFQQTGSPFSPSFYSPKLWHVLSYCSFYQVYNYSSKPLLIQQLEICGNCYQCSSCTSTTRFNVQNPAARNYPQISRSSQAISPPQQLKRFSNTESEKQVN